MAPSSWRPPWFADDLIASAPTFSAIRASSASRMPLRMTLPPQLFLQRAILSQSKDVGSNCSAVQAQDLRYRSTPCTCPRCYQSCRRLAPIIADAPRLHFVAKIGESVLAVSLGGADRPFFRSLCRCPRICQIQALITRGRGHLGIPWRGWDLAGGRNLHRACVKAGTRRVLLSASATSSIELIGHGRQGKGHAKGFGGAAALISPSALLHAVSPTGASAHGIATSARSSAFLVLRPLMSTARHAAQAIWFKGLGVFSRQGLLCPAARFRVVIEHPRQHAFMQALEVIDGCDQRHDGRFYDIASDDLTQYGPLKSNRFTLRHVDGRQAALGPDAHHRRSDLTKLQHVFKPAARCDFGHDSRPDDDAIRDTCNASALGACSHPKTRRFGRPLAFWIAYDFGGEHRRVRFGEPVMPVIDT